MMDLEVGRPSSSNITPRLLEDTRHNNWSAGRQSSARGAAETGPGVDIGGANAPGPPAVPCGPAAVAEAKGAAVEVDSGLGTGCSARKLRKRLGSGSFRRPDKPRGAARLGGWPGSVARPLRAGA